MYYIGADIGGTSTKIGIIDGNGNIVSRGERLHDPDRGVMDELISCIGELMNPEIAGIGISSAGCIDSLTGSVAENGGNIRDWSYTPVCSILRREFGVPATMANDANCAVMGEFWKGAARGYSDIVGITLGTGVGGGVITGGRLLEGARGYGGEIGHFPTHAGGEECVCGNRGCYEKYASTSALTGKASLEVPEWRNGLAFFDAAASGNELALGILDGWIDEIASGLAGFIHIFNPQLILIGGGVSVQKELLIDPLRERTLSMLMPDFAEGLRFCAAELGNDAGMIGAVKYFLGRHGDDADSSGKNRV